MAIFAVESFSKSSARANFGFPGFAKHVVVHWVCVRSSTQTSPARNGFETLAVKSTSNEYWQCAGNILSPCPGFPTRHFEPGFIG